LSQKTALRIANRIPEDPLEFWLSRLDSVSRKNNQSQFNRWMTWLHEQQGWENVTPRELLVRQLEEEDKYVILDLLQGYVGSLVLRKTSKRTAYSAIRSFFIHNRVELPRDLSFHIRGDKPPVQAKLTVQDVVEVAMAAKQPYRSIILFKWQSFLDSARLIYTNNHASERLVKQLKADVHPIRIDLPGRKSNENDPEGQFFTYIGHDAKNALLDYFEKVRGWPEPGEPIWTFHEGKRKGKPVSKKAFEATWIALLRRTGKVPPANGSLGNRYGLNPHEFRDLAISRLHTHAKNRGFDMDCTKFWCGQVGEVDKLKYDKFYTDTEYVREQYLTAESYLNIISNPAGAGPETLLQDPTFVQSLIKNREFIEALRTALNER